MKRRIFWDPECGEPEFDPDPQYHQINRMMQTWRIGYLDDEEQVQRYLEAERQYRAAKQALHDASDHQWWNHFFRLAVIPAYDPDNWTAPVLPHPTVRLSVSGGRRAHNAADRVAQQVGSEIAEVVEHRLDRSVRGPVERAAQRALGLWDDEE